MTNSRARSSNLQCSGDGEGKVREGGARVKEEWSLWQNCERSEDFYYFTPRRGVNGSCQVGMVRPIGQTGQTGRPLAAEK